MATTLVQSKVRDYATWKKAFDSLQELRKSSGAVTDHIYRDADDPSKIIAILKWSSISNARKYYKSAEFKSALVKAGAEGTTIAFLDDA